MSKMYLSKLESADFEVSLAFDGEMALKKLSEEKADLVLLDIVLPKKDGFQILDAIKKNAKLKNVKVILLTNLGQEEDVKKGQELGADDYLVKAHYTPSEILEKIKKIINEY